MPSTSTLLRLIAGLVSCLVITSTIACKKKTTRRATITSQFPEGGDGTRGGSDSCAYSIAFGAAAQPVDPMDLRIASLEVDILGGTYRVSVTEPEPPAPASHRIAYEVCPQDRTNGGCTLHSIKSLEDFNVEIPAGTSEFTAWACCNHSDKLCKPETPGYVEKKLGPAGHEKVYLCGKPASLFENLAPTPGLSLTNSDKNQELYLAELDRRVERAATESFGLIREKAKATEGNNLRLTNSQQDEKPYYQAIVDGGFDKYLRIIDTIGLELAESVATTPSDTSGTGLTSLKGGLALTNEDCLPTTVEPDTYPPLENPYDTDPGTYTPPETSDEEDKDKEQEETDDSQEYAQLQAACDAVALKYQEAGEGTAVWDPDTNECYAVSDNGERKLIDPTSEPNFESDSATAQNSEKGPSGWEVGTGLFIAAGAVVAAGGVALYYDSKYPADADKLVSSKNKINERINKLPFVQKNEKGELVLVEEYEDEAGNKVKTTPEQVGEYHKLKLREQRLEFETELTTHKQALMKYEELTGDIEALKDSKTADGTRTLVDKEKELAEHRRKFGLNDEAIDPKKEFQILQDRVTVYEDLTNEANPTKSAGPSNQRFNPDASEFTFTSGGRSVKLTQAEFEELFKGLDPEINKLERTRNFDTFKKDISVLNTSRAEVGDPNFVSRVKQAWTNRRSHAADPKRLEFSKKAFKYGIGAIVVGVLAQQVFSLSNDPVDKELSNLANFIVKTQLRAKACATNLNNCRD